MNPGLTVAVGPGVFIGGTGREQRERAQPCGAKEPRPKLCAARRSQTVFLGIRDKRPDPHMGPGLLLHRLVADTVFILCRNPPQKDGADRARPSKAAIRQLPEQPSPLKQPSIYAPNTHPFFPAVLFGPEEGLALWKSTGFLSSLYGTDE